jgi:phage-related protein
MIQMFVSPTQAWENFKNSLDKGAADLIKLFPQFGVAVEKVGEVFSSVSDGIAESWNFIIDIIKSSIDAVMGAINAISNAYSKVKEFFGGGNTEVNQNISSAKDAINIANSTPLASQSTTSIVSASRALTRNTSVQTGDINIRTSATDAQGISSQIGSTLNDQMRKTVNDFDDGVAA